MREHEEISRIHARRHDIFTSTFWSALDETGRVDLEAVTEDDRSVDRNLVTRTEVQHVAEVESIGDLHPEDILVALLPQHKKKKP